MKPEELLHLFSPYLPTDRFRALLRNSDLPTSSEGAALLVDISGFTPLTTRLVVEYGPERASEELKRRLNPMFEAIAGQVFHHGGSVIRFTGDGFIAWFDDAALDQAVDAAVSVPAVLRAVAAGLEMQAVMPLFRGLRLKVCVAGGKVYRWVVGHPQHGLNDVLLGPAVEAMLTLAGEAQPGQVMAHQGVIGWLRGEGAAVEMCETGNAVVSTLSDTVLKEARRHRWNPWAVEGDVQQTLSAVRHFVDSAIRDRVEGGLGDFVAELRYAIPMFVQLNGVSPDAPNARQMLDDQVRTVQNVLASFGGRFVSAEVADKGSVLFGVFGAPISYGDDAERAIRAAIALRDLRNGPDGLDGLAIQRIGVSRGLLYAGTVGGEVRHEYSTIGDETNIASRLMSAASAGQILTTSAVRNEVGPRVTFHDLPPLTVKGREQPIAVTEPIAIQMGTRQQARVGELIGREQELNQLYKALNSVRKGYPRIVRVEGQAGIGKSRLVAELLATANNDFQAAGGDCVSTGRNMAYLPWSDVFVSLMGLDVDDEPEANVRRVYAFVDKANHEWLPRVPLLGDLLRLPIGQTPTTALLEGRPRHQMLSALVIDLLLSIARQKPLLIILEDTHWIDELSEALALDLTRRLMMTPVPILLLLVHRPLVDNDHTQQIVAALDEMHIASHMQLDELSRNAVTDLIEKYLDAGIPPELSRFVYERAHGNPFYIQEVIDALTETGYIKRIGSIIFIERNLNDANLPQTIQTLVQARIDRLNELDKLVLKVAAVIGREFAVRVLVKSIPIPMAYDELLQRLRTLEEHDFSYLETPEPEMTYLFKHAITQEVTYQSLLFAQRRQLHQAVASSLEVLAPEATERLAYHFAHSGDDERARHYLHLAGEKAYREYANQAALGYFTQALSLAQDDEARFEINRRRLQIMLRLGDMQSVQAELPAVQELATSNNRTDWQAAVHLFWANYHTQTSAWARVIEEAQNAVICARRVNDDTLAWDGYLLLRDAYLRLNQRQQGEQVVRTMQPLAERLCDTHRHIRLALLEAEDGYSDNADISIMLTNAAVDQAQELEDPLLEAEAWSTLARLYSRENNLPAALDAYDHQIALLRQIGDRRHEGLTLLNIGATLVSLGELSEGNAHLLDAYKILHQIGERSGEASSLINLGIIAMHHKAYDEALAYMNRGLALHRSLNTQADSARALYHMANVYVLQNNLAAAVSALDEARAFFEANGLTQNIDEIYTALSEIDFLRNDLVAARAHIAPLLPRLIERHVHDLFLPGLAYWRTIQILEQCGEKEQAAKVRTAFTALMQTTLNSLTEARREALINKIWYHAALLQA